MTLRVVNPFIPSCGWRGSNAACRLIAGRGRYWPILVCTRVVPWGWRAMKMSSHSARVEVVGMPDLFCGSFEPLQSKYVSHHE